MQVANKPAFAIPVLDHEQPTNLGFFLRISLVQAPEAVQGLRLGKTIADIGVVNDARPTKLLRILGITGGFIRAFGAEVFARPTGIR